MRDCGYDHRRRQRSRRLRREVCARGRHGDADRHAVLVLRLRNDGYGPADPEGGLGLQRHRAARRGLPGRGAGGACAERAAGFRHLRARRSGGDGYDDSGRRPRENSRVCARRGRGRHDARQIVPVDGQRGDGHRRFDCRSRILRGLSEHALRRRRTADSTRTSTTARTANRRPTRRRSGSMWSR